MNTSYESDATLWSEADLCLLWDRLERIFCTKARDALQKVLFPLMEVMRPYLEAHP